MSIKRFNEFPAGSGSLTNDDILLFMDDPNGSGVTKQISLSEIANLIGGGGGGGAEINDLTSIVTWANVPDANITESSVVQHSGALRITESQIVDLQNYVTNGDNVSVLANDANYIASGDNVSALANDANYIASGDNVSALANDANYIASGDNVSVLANDANYIASGDNVSALANDANYIISDNSVAAGSDTINNIIDISQAEYDAITPAVGVLYVINDAPDPITSLPSSGNWDAAYNWVSSSSGVVIFSGNNISLLNNDNNYVESDIVGITGASLVNNIIVISQTDYDNIGSGNYDPNTIYFVS